MAYVPLGMAYASSPVRSIRQQADRILVTCGGSDPFEVTAKVLTGLAEIHDRTLDIRLVVGPGFARAYLSSLATMAEPFLHRVEFVASPASLAALK